MKRDYSRYKEEQLQEKVKELKMDMIKAGTLMGQSKVGKRKKEGSGIGSDLQKRLRKEMARLLTELNKRRKDET